MLISFSFKFLFISAEKCNASICSWYWIYSLCMYLLSGESYYQNFVVKLSLVSWRLQCSHTTLFMSFSLTWVSSQFHSSSWHCLAVRWFANFPAEFVRFVLVCNGSLLSVLSFDLMFVVFYNLNLSCMSDTKSNTFILVSWFASKSCTSKAYNAEVTMDKRMNAKFSECSDFSCSRSDGSLEPVTSSSAAANKLLQANS